MERHAKKRLVYENSVINQREKLYTEGEAKERQDLRKIKSGLTANEKSDMFKSFESDAREMSLIQNVQRNIKNMQSLKEIEVFEEEPETEKFSKTPSAFNKQLSLKPNKLVEKSKSIKPTKKLTTDLSTNNIFRRSLFVDDGDTKDNKYNHFDFHGQKDYQSFVVNKVKKQNSIKVNINAEGNINKIGFNNHKKVNVDEAAVRGVFEEYRREWVKDNKLCTGQNVSLISDIKETKKMKLARLLQRLTELEKAAKK